jgi:hypothetical protein
MTHILKDAIERSQSFDPKSIQEALLTTDVQGASGRIRFDSKGGVVKIPLFKTLHGIERVTLPDSPVTNN